MITYDGFETLTWLHHHFGLNFSDLTLPRGQISGFQVLSAAADLPSIQPYIPKKKFFLPYTDQIVKAEHFQSQLESIFQNPGRKFDILYHIVNQVLQNFPQNSMEGNLDEKLMELLIRPLREKQTKDPLREIGTVELLESIYENPYFDFSSFLW